MRAVLEGVQVLDLSRVLAGPYCTMLLADQGADVIKVERPDGGDDTRHWGPPFAAGESAYYLSCNRNKRGITLNLKTAAGRELARRLAERSDVLVENFLPGTLDRWGLGFAELSQRNPRLVYCSITGFGQTGPRSAEPGYDIMIQALAGVMSITGEPDGPPMKLGVAISDITAGLFACQAIVGALYAREMTGQGERIDISLFDATLAWLANVGQNYLVSGEVPQRLGTAHPNIVPYQAFQAADESLIIAVGTDAQFRRFCDLLGRPELADDARYATNALRVEHRDTLIPLIAAAVRGRLASDWLARLDAADIPCGAVNTIDRALGDPQAAARGMVQHVAHPTIGDLKLAGSPVKLQNASHVPIQPPPLLGQHTDLVLRDMLRLTAAEIRKLRESGAV
ncbi:MAG: CaiB/BaiF CoA transferase family protein [Planctomycetaceae bacterium]